MAGLTGTAVGEALDEAADAHADPGCAPPAKSLDLAKHQQVLRAHLDPVLDSGVIGLVADSPATS